MITKNRNAELLRLLEEGKWVDGTLEFDECGNEWRTNIYELDEKLYAVDVLNGGTKSDKPPVPVTKHTRMVEYVYYCDPAGQEVACRENDYD